MEGSYSVSTTEPPPHCGHCGSCNAPISIDCFAKQHLAYCEAASYGFKKCGKLYSIENGCWKHPKWGNHNQDTKPCLSPRTTRATLLVDHAKMAVMQRGPPVLRGTAAEIVWTGPRTTAKEPATPAPPEQTICAEIGSSATPGQHTASSDSRSSEQTSPNKNSGRSRSSSSSTQYHDTASLPSVYVFDKHPLHFNTGAIEGH